MRVYTLKFGVGLCGKGGGHGVSLTIIEGAGGTQERMGKYGIINMPEWRGKFR
jgi:hypothetical protein